MMLCAALVGLVFGVVSPQKTLRARALTGLRTFGEFMGIGLLLAWLLYFFPWG
jgi:hypothetical protein